ncbi:PRD domain-containing protein [Vagococcus martis]
MVKSLNNNLVLAVSEHDEEFVLFGKGIGFKKKKNDLVDKSLITKTFLSKDNQNMVAIIESIQPDVLDVTEKIVTYGEGQLNKKLNGSLMIALADHIQCAIDRQKQGIDLPENTMQWEIPFLYSKEHELGKYALEQIKTELEISLPSSEAAFMALHFVNAQDGVESMDETIFITKILKSIVKSIQTLFNVSLKKDSLNYSRFVTHIRYFMNRHLHNKVQESNENEKLFDIIKEQYPKSYACSLVIKEMLNSDYNIDVSNDELIYLIIHIERVVSDTQALD